MKWTRTILGVLTLSIIFMLQTAYAQQQLDDNYKFEEEDELDEAVIPAKPAKPAITAENQQLIDDYAAAGDDDGFNKAIMEQGVTEYTVQEGDTLWDICERTLGSPWFWPKVWAMNQQIENAHYIEPGDVIKFHPAGQMGTMVNINQNPEGQQQPIMMAGQPESVQEDQMSMIQKVMDTDAWGTVSEGGKYRLQKYLTKISSSAFNFYNFRRDGFLAKNELKNFGEIANSPEDRDLLVKYDSIYIKPQDINQFSIGQSYQIFRQLGKVKHPATGDTVGYKVKVLGKCVIKRISKDVVTAQITTGYDTIERGDLIRPWKNPVKDISPRRNKVTLHGYIVDTLVDNVLLGEHQIVFLDKGISQGIEEGNRLFVIHSNDPSGYDDGFDNDQLPPEKVGELIILSSGSNSSVGLVTRSIVTLNVGDRVVMEKNY